MSNSQLITQFIDCWCRKDLDGIMAFFTEDAVYTNIPIDPPNVGLEAIRNTIAGFIGMAEELDFIIHHQSETDAGIVMNERTDRFLIEGNWLELPVMGVFEFRDGKISAWRDYFDMAPFNQQGD